MSNQLISSEYLYKGKIYYYLVKYPICPGNKQIYNEKNDYDKIFAQQHTGRKSSDGPL